MKNIVQNIASLRIGKHRIVKKNRHRPPLVVVDGDVNDVLLMIVRLTIVMMLTMQRAQAIRLGSSEAPARHKLIAN